MYVQNRMNTDIVTIFPDASISLAFQLMMEKGYSQLPVIEGRKFLGMITEKLLTEVSPSKATSLSMYELNYLLSKTKVRDIMVTDIVTITPDMLIEEAAVLMRDKEVDALPVTDKNLNFLGLLTRTDILDAFIELMGFNDSGTRISLEVKDELGTLADISSIIKEYGMNINHISNFNSIGEDNRSEIVIRLNTVETDELVQVLQSKGYTILSIKKQ